MADFDGIIQPSAEWVDIPSLSDTALAKGGTAGAGVMNAQATALAKRTNYLYNYTIQYDQNTGYVGINTPIPSVPLEISVLGGGTYSSSSTTVASPYIASKLSQLSNSNNTQSLQSFSVKYGGASWYVGAISNGGYVAPFVFGSRTGATAYSEVARFDANLNFGLGTTTPFNITGYKIVDIRGSSGSFYYGGNSAANKSFRVGYSAANDALELNAITNNAVMIKTFDASRIFIDNVGTVGINTVTTSGGTGNTAVEGKLIVYQSSSNVPALTVPYPGSVYAGFKLVHHSTNASGASNYIDFKARPSYTGGIASGADNTFLRVVNTYPRTNTDLNLNPEGGNVGIGVNPSTWTTYKALEISSGGHGIFGTVGTVGMSQNATLNTTWKYSTTGAAARYLQSGGTHFWQYATSGASGGNITWVESMRIDATGNIGIGGVPSPTTTLDVNGSIKTNATLLVSSYANIGSLVANDPGSAYYGYTNRIGGTVGISSGLGINVQSASLTSTLQVGGDVRAISSKGFTFGGQFRNLIISSTGTSPNVSIYTDAIVVENSIDTIVLRSITINASTAVSGVGGLDTGTATTNTWYSVWIIYNPTTQQVGSLLSISATSPVVQSGYTHKTRIGWIKTDSTSNKYPLAFNQKNNLVRYLVSGNVSNPPIFASGIVGNLTTPTWVSYTVRGTGTSAIVPPTAYAVDVGAASNNSTTLVAPSNLYGNNVSATNRPPLTSSFSASSTLVMARILLESNNLYYAADGSSAYACIFGWEDNL